MSTPPPRMSACNAGHALKTRRVEDAGRSCDLCERSLPRGSSASSCKACDFDVCEKCATSSSSMSSAALQCARRHALVARAIPAKGHACDECEASLPKGTAVMSCAKCEYDLCVACQQAVSASASATATASASAPSAPASVCANVRTVLLDIQPRRMWGWGPRTHGYCGETCIQTAGLLFGQYVSQEHVRYAGGNAEILVDVNAHTAAEALQLRVERWDCEGEPRPQAERFAAWARRHLDAGHPIVFGVYQTKLYGDDEYDHIVLATGYDAHAESGALVCLRYNDLFLTEHLRLEHVRTRTECAHRAPPTGRGEFAFEYSLPRMFVSAMAVCGVAGADSGKEPRVQLDLDRCDEPDWGAEDGLNEKPVDLRVRARISGLTAGVAYALVCVPLRTSQASSARWTHRLDFVAAAATHTVADLVLRSDAACAYRCVPVAVLDSGGGIDDGGGAADGACVIS